MYKDYDFDTYQEAVRLAAWVALFLRVTQLLLNWDLKHY